MNQKIIGYIHVCQIDGWKRSFDIIFNCIQNFGLYEATDEIRIGVISDTGILIKDKRFDDPKIKIIYTGKSNEYERPTLLHMRETSSIDNPCKYWYLHTKGLRHFNTDRENFIIDWIHLMLYWNIIKWKLAVEKLDEGYDIYGCEELMKFYSGNYWWASSKHILRLPTVIGCRYTEPEEWIMTVKENIYSVYSSGIQGQGHYYRRYPKELYYLPDDKIYILIPDDFNIYEYKELNKDIKNMLIDQCIEHYIKHGIYENRKTKKNIDTNKEIYKNTINNTSNIDFKNMSLNKYLKYHLTKENKKFEINKNIELNNNILSNKNNTIPLDFDYLFYKYYYDDLNDMSEEELKTHWIKNGKNEKRIYRGKTLLPTDFDFNFYRTHYKDNKDKTNQELIEHYINIGKFEDRLYKPTEQMAKDYKLPNDFDPSIYRNKYKDLVLLLDNEVTDHWLENGRYELRNYK